MRLHLGVDQVDKDLTVEEQDVFDILGTRQVGLQVGDDLARQLVEQVRLTLIVDVVALREQADEVVLQPGFLDERPVGDEAILLVGPQFLKPSGVPSGRKMRMENPRLPLGIIRRLQIRRLPCET
jgi:hypothetical protein